MKLRCGKHSSSKCIDSFNFTIFQVILIYFIRIAQDFIGNAEAQNADVDHNRRNWFKIDEGSLQIEDGEVPCLPTGYKCDYNEDCCDGMCVLSKLSKHRLCLVVGWKGELKLRDIYNHNPLRPEDVEYLRRTYNFSEDVSTKSSKRQIHVVYDEDIYDIPSLPDENKLFPITDDPVMYNVITTTQTTTTNSRTRNYSNLARARTKNTNNFPEQIYGGEENYTNTLLSQNYTGFKKSNVEKQNVNPFPSIRNYEDLVQYDLVNTDVERVPPQGTRRNTDNSSEKTTEQNDFVRNDSEYNVRKNFNNISSEQINIVTENSFNSYKPSTELLRETFSDENITVITENTFNTEVSADTPLNLINVLTNKLAIKPPSTNLDDGLTVRSKNSLNISTENYKILPTVEIRQEEFLASSLTENITSSEINTALTAVFLTTTEMLGIYNDYDDTQDLQVTSIPKAVDTESLIHDYKPEKPSDTDFSVASSIFASRKQTTLITTEVENVTDFSKKMNENISFRENLVDSGFVNSTNGDKRQENEEVTEENSTEFASSIPFVNDNLLTPNLDKVTKNYTELNGEVISGYNYTKENTTEFASSIPSVNDNLLTSNLDKVTKNYTELNGDVISGYNYTDSSNVETTVTYIPYVSDDTTLDYSRHSNNTTLLTNNLRDITNNFTNIDVIISSRDYAYSDVVNETTVKNFGYENTEITGNYSTKFRNTLSTGVPSTFSYTTVHEGRKSKRGIWKKIKHGMGKVFHHKKRKHTDKPTTEDYNYDSENELLKFNIFKENKTTTRKKSKTKKLLKGLKKFFHKKHNTTDAENISASRMRELENSIEEKSQSGFVTSKNKHIIDDVKGRYKNSFVLPLNETKRRGFMSKAKGWFQFPQKKRKENTSVNQNYDSRVSKNFMQRTREKFGKVIGRYNKGKPVSENRTSKYSYHETITALPAASENLRISTRSNLERKNKPKFKLWSRIKRLLVRKRDGNVSSTDSDDPAVINDFSIRELHTDLI